MLKINIGSLSQLKIQAVASTFKEYVNIFGFDFDIQGIQTTNPEFAHPIGIEATVNGALQRAEEAFIDCDYSVGIEGGLIEVPHISTKYMEISYCVIKSKIGDYHGMGCGFEWPKSVTEYITSGKGDASKAFRELNLTDSTKLGLEKGGIVGYLTNYRIGREDIIRQSLIMALIHLEQETVK